MTGRSSEGEGPGAVGVLLAGGAMLLGGCAGPMGGAGGSAALASFGAGDAMRDGSVREMEFREAVDERFETLDADGSGGLSFGEYERGVEARNGGGGRVDPSRVFARIDDDGDGLVSEAEFHAAAGALFDRLDSDGDGVVTRDEVEERGGRRGFRRGRG